MRVLVKSYGHDDGLDERTVDVGVGPTKLVADIVAIMVGEEIEANRDVDVRIAPDEEGSC